MSKRRTGTKGATPEPAKIGTRRAWPPELVAVLGQPLDRESARTFDDSMSAVRRRRSNRKRFPKL